MSTITYQIPPRSAPASEVLAVFLDGTRVGAIHKREKNACYAYKPKGSQCWGEEFPKLSDVKRSIEGEVAGVVG